MRLVDLSRAALLLHLQVLSVKAETALSLILRVWSTGCLRFRCEECLQDFDDRQTAFSCSFFIIIFSALRREKGLGAIDRLEALVFVSAVDLLVLKNLLRLPRGRHVVPDHDPSSQAPIKRATRLCGKEASLAVEPAQRRRHGTTTAQPPLPNLFSLANVCTSRHEGAKIRDIQKGTRRCARRREKREAGRVR